MSTLTKILTSLLFVLPLSAQSSFFFGSNYTPPSSGGINFVCSGGTGDNIPTGFVFVNSSNNVIHGNTICCSGNYTTALSFDSNSNGNFADDNQWPLSAISNSGLNFFGTFSGSSAPSGACPMSSYYINTSGTSGGSDTAYVCIGGSWVNYK
jgi:hypothetical protein